MFDPGRTKFLKGTKKGPLFSKEGPKKDLLDCKGKAYRVGGRSSFSCQKSLKYHSCESICLNEKLSDKQVRKAK